MNQLRYIRAERELTLRDLAQKSGVSKDTVSEIERGVRKPHPTTVGKLAKALGVEVGELMGATVYPKGFTLSSPQVREWLRGHGAKFALMSDEAFSDYVLGVPLDLNLEGRPEGIDRLIRQIDAENGAIVGALRAEPRLGGTLFPKLRRDTPDTEKRDVLRESWNLERNLESLYNRLRRIVAGYSRDLYYAGQTGDFLTDPRRVEEERAQALEAAFAEEGVA